MKVEEHSYRFAKQILQHPDYLNAWTELYDVIKNTPLFVFAGKSKTKSQGHLDVVQQLLNAYYDRRLSVDLGWEYHPLATRIPNSGLAADFRKQFGDLVIQVEVQFGNISRWYSDIFKFQTAYSQQLTNIGVCVLPCLQIANRIDSNVANYERALRELPSAELSITLPILLAGLALDGTTPIVDVKQTQFGSIEAICKGDNPCRIVHAHLTGVPMHQVGQHSPTGPMLPPSAKAAAATAKAADRYAAAAARAAAKAAAAVIKAAAATDKAAAAAARTAEKATAAADKAAAKAAAAPAKAAAAAAKTAASTAYADDE
jgi:hypothetical protein